MTDDPDALNGVPSYEPVDLFSGFRVCEECGAMVPEDMWPQHDGWHDRINEAL